MTIIGAIDCGTNTVRLIVAKKTHGVITPLFEEQTITRLGEGLATSGRLSPAAMDRTVSGIKAMVAHGQAQVGEFTLHIFATAAARNAANTADLSTTLTRGVGVGLTVIPWQEEARFALKGVRLGIDPPLSRFLLFDIGGGSTEFILANGDEVAGSFGTDIGVVRLTERFVTTHPTALAEYAAVCSEIRPIITAALSTLPINGATTLVGTAGTVTSLAAVALGMTDYDPARINNFKITTPLFTEWKAKLLAMTLDQRRAYPSLAHGREDLIVAGLAIIETVMEEMKVTEMVVVDSGLREGLLYHLFEQQERSP